MAHVFSITVSGDPEKLFNLASERAAQKGLTISGDLEGGRFNGMGVEGGFSISGNTAIFTIEKSPFFLPAKAIESQVRNFFAGS